jgi:hypothetical protein
MLVRQTVKTFMKMVAASVVVAGVCVSCGGPQGPDLGSEKQKGVESLPDPMTAKPLSAARPSGERISELTDAVRFNIFSRPLEPLTIQKGGSVKFALPLSEEVISSGSLKSAEFRMTAEGVSGSVSQGKTLSIAVAEEAAEGRYTGRLVFKLSNGREAVQNLQVSVIP